MVEKKFDLALLGKQSIDDDYVLNPSLDNECALWYVQF